MLVISYPAFDRVVKKFHSNAKKDLDKTIKILIKNPKAGELKKSNLKDLSVYKFTMVHQLTLLAYKYDEVKKILTLLALGPHEYFYRDLKK